MDSRMTDKHSALPLSSSSVLGPISAPFSRPVAVNYGQLRITEIGL